MERTTRTYSDSQRAKALATLDLNEGNLAKTSRDMDIPYTTLLDWRDGKHNEEVTELRDREKQDLASRFEQLAHLYISRATDTVEHAKGTQAIVGAATATDKMRLLREQPTSITAQQNIEPIALAIQSAWNKYKLFCEQNNIDHPSEKDLIERINRVANERNVDAKMLAERVLKAD
jgi:transposase-like protein